MKLVVITSVPDPLSAAGRSNMAGPGASVRDVRRGEAGRPDDELGKLYMELGPPLGIQAASEDMQLGLRLQVFRVGDVLFVDDEGREIGGRRRNPSRWGVVFETFVIADHHDDLVNCATCAMAGVGDLLATLERREQQATS